MKKTPDEKSTGKSAQDQHTHDDHLKHPDQEKSDAGKHRGAQTDEQQSQQWRKDQQALGREKQNQTANTPRQGEHDRNSQDQNRQRVGGDRSKR